MKCKKAKYKKKKKKEKQVNYEREIVGLDTILFK